MYRALWLTDSHIGERGELANWQAVQPNYEGAEMSANATHCIYANIHVCQTLLFI